MIIVIIPIIETISNIIKVSLPRTIRILLWEENTENHRDCEILQY